MSNKLQPCWHCGKEVHIKDIIDEKGLLMHEFVCTEGSSCLGSGLFTAFFPEKKRNGDRTMEPPSPALLPRQAGGCDTGPLLARHSRRRKDHGADMGRRRELRLVHTRSS